MTTKTVTLDLVARVTELKETADRLATARDELRLQAQQTAECLFDGPAHVVLSPRLSVDTLNDIKARAEGILSDDREQLGDLDDVVREARELLDVVVFHAERAVAVVAA